MTAKPSAKRVYRKRGHTLWPIPNFVIAPITVEALLSGHPLLSGQLSKSPNFCQYNAVNKISIKRPPFGRPDEGFLPLFSGHRNFLRVFWLCVQIDDDRYESKIESDDR